MTVADLIEKLQTMPPETPVIIRMCSEYIGLDAEDVRLEGPDKKWIVRHGTYMQFHPMWWDKEKDGEPQFLTVCTFPGN